MAKAGTDIEKIVTEIDWFIIERIRELRKDKFSQVDLSIEIGFSEGFISRIENPRYNAVYSHRHLNLIAKALKVRLTDIIPEKPFSNDLIRITVRVLPVSRPKLGEANYIVLKKIPLTEEEIKDYNKRTLSRPKKNRTSESFKNKIKKNKR